ARSDLYSLACVAYEMLTGAPPFGAPTPMAVLARHVLEPVPPLRKARQGVPKPVAEAIERALAKAPADRFATVAEWRDSLMGPASPESAVELRPPEAELSSQTLAPLTRPSIAILPFKQLGSDRGREFVADGIRLGIQATLVQLSGLFLVNASTPNLYRDSDASAKSVGQELGVRYILEGAAQQAGAQIRVTVQLTDVEAGRVTWAERYDRKLENVFELQDEITRQVTHALNVRLNYAETMRGWFAELVDPEAWEYFYRGAHHLYEGTKDDNARAREMFTELYRVAPESVSGPSNIAVTHWLDAFNGWSDSPADSLKEARRWARTAMEYEDNNGIGHAIYGHLLLLERKYDEALAVCEEATTLRNSCPLAHGVRGLVLNYCGDSTRAVQEVQQALNLERVYPPWLLTWLATAYRDGGQVENSIATARQSLRMDPKERDALLVLCSDYQLAGRSDDARRIADDVRRRDPDFRLATYAEGHPYRDVAVLDRLTAALRAAGLPD
ncbi:MAG: hypothetical protein KJO65_10425, partial [Gemmatimonadetes bacterium]|nr:hypothetical protein [Gemmatimonadota bacterium]